MFVYGWLKQSNDDRLAGLNTLKFSVWISRGAGLALGIDGLLLTLPGKLAGRNGVGYRVRIAVGGAARGRQQS